MTKTGVWGRTYLYKGVASPHFPRIMSAANSQLVKATSYGRTLGYIRILGIGLELACNGGSCEGISLKTIECNLHSKRFPGISLTCKLVPVQYREYEYGLLSLPVMPRTTSFNGIL